MASASYPSLGLCDFHFDSMETTEDITYYFSGGYHPIVIGDVLSPSGENSRNGSRQYRIMRKLGYGSYSTVWLAQKTDSSEAFVAVKVAMAVDDLTREVAMLEAASKYETNDRQPSHFLNLLDHFTLRGPNGTHFVLVTEIVVSISSLLSPKRPPLWHKTTAHGLVQAVANLHSAGIIHGDLHIGNVGFAIPQIAEQDAHTIMQDLSSYDVTIIVPKSAANQTPSLPAYVLAPSDLARYYNRIAGKDLRVPHVKIFDFGSAHEVGMHPLKFQCAVEACAPELAFAQVVEEIDNPPVEPPADVWALGAAIYEIVTTNPLFYGVGMTALPRRMVVMASSLPLGWEDWYDSLPDPPEVSSSSADAWWAERRRRLRKHCADEASTDALVTLLRKILVLDPALRPTAAEVLQDPWFLHG